jgi:hypothetical protein
MYLPREMITDDNADGREPYRGEQKTGAELQGQEINVC